MCNELKVYKLLNDTNNQTDYLVIYKSELFRQIH